MKDASDDDQARELLSELARRLELLETYANALVVDIKSAAALLPDEIETNED